MPSTPISEISAEVKYFGDSAIESLNQAGYESLEDLQGIDRLTLTNISGIGDSVADQILLALDRRGLRTFDDASQENLIRLKSLLKELFRTEYADIDHGIYRVLGQRQDRIEEFIHTELPAVVEDAFAEVEAVEQNEHESSLEEVREEIREHLGPEYLDDSGAPIDPFPDVAIANQLRQRYERLAERDAVSEREQDAKATVYSDVYQFFNRYYDRGDFVTQLRLADDDKYAVPYDGSETLYHWANRDQYFIKTRELLSDFQFHDDSYLIEFTIHEAEVDAANKQGSEKYFFLRDADPVEQDDRSLTIQVHFEYRELREEETHPYDVSGHTRENTQEEIQATNEALILDALSDDIADRLREPTETGREQSKLQVQLRRFAMEVANDYFVHRDLEKFLSQELDYYLNTQVLGGGTDSWQDPDPIEQARAAATERIASKIIDFVSQIEDFQRRLFTKRKFVVDSGQFLSLESIPEDHLEAVLDNDAQREQWAEWFDIARDGVPSPDRTQLDTYDGVDWEASQHVQFAQAHPGLPVDTSLFSQRIADALRSETTDIGHGLDGLLLNSDNYQALQLLREQYRNRVRGIYIDPPYNTENDQFEYKDNYQHSTWLTMMRDRIEVARELLRDDGLFFVSIDDNEQERLKTLLNQLFGEENYLATIIWDKNHSQQAGNFKVYHEYVHVYAKDIEAIDKSGFRAVSDEDITAGAQKIVSEKNPPAEFTFPAGTRVDTNNQLRFEEGEYIGNPDGEWSKVVEGPFHAKDGELQSPVTLRAAWTQLEQMREWFSDSDEEVLDSKNQPVLEFYFNGAGKLQYRKERLRESVKTLREYGTQGNASDHLDEFFSGEAGYSYPKPVEMMEDVVQWLSEPEEQNIFLDFFAGSGTFAEGVINANQADEIDRSVILVDMGEYFDDLLVPRVLKTAYAAEWDDGTPEPGTQRRAGHSFRYEKLEQFDDTLDNLELSDERQATFQSFEEYLLRYMLKFEPAGPSLLDRDAFKTPFEYMLSVREGAESTPQEVDLPTTFNHLLGLDVSSQERVNQDGRQYLFVTGVDQDGQETGVAWRSTVDLDYDADRDCITDHFDASVEQI